MTEWEEKTELEYRLNWRNEIGVTKLENRMGNFMEMDYKIGTPSRMNVRNSVASCPQ